MAKPKKTKKKTKKPVVEEEEEEEDDVESQQQPPPPKKEEEEDREEEEEGEEGWTNRVTPFFVQLVMVPSQETASTMQSNQVYQYVQKRTAVLLFIALMVFGTRWNVWQFTLPFSAQELLLWKGEQSKDTLGASVMVSFVLAFFLVFYTMPLLVFPFVEDRYTLVLFTCLSVGWILNRKAVGILFFGLSVIVILSTLSMNKQVDGMGLVRLACVFAIASICQEPDQC